MATATYLPVPSFFSDSSSVLSILSNISKFTCSEIGQGTFSTVYKIEGTKYALKKIKITEQGVFNGVVQTELDILSSLQHPNILSLLHYDSQQTTFVLPLAECDLDELLERKRYFNDSEVIDAAKQLSSALDYIHSNNILHLDLTTRNVFVVNNKRYLIGDFSLSVRSKSLQTNGEFLKIAADFRPPENVTRQPYYYTYASDIYSLGLVIFSFIYGRSFNHYINNYLGYSRDNYEDQVGDFYNKIMVNVNENWPPKLLGRKSELLPSEIISFDPNERPTAAQIAAYYYKLDGNQTYYTFKRVQVKSGKDLMEPPYKIRLEDYFTESELMETKDIEEVLLHTKHLYTNIMPLIDAEEDKLHLLQDYEIDAGLKYWYLQCLRLVASIFGYRDKIASSIYRDTYTEEKILNYTKGILNAYEQ